MNKSTQRFIWIASLLSVGGLTLLFFPRYSKVRPESVAVSNTNALRHIAQAIIYTANENGGEFPASLGPTLVKDFHLDGIYRQIALQADGDVHYFKPAANLKAIDPNHILLVWPHALGTSICFADGRGQTLLRTSPGWTQE